MTSLGETLARMGRRDEAERYFAGLLARRPEFARRARRPRLHPHRGRPGRRTRAICSSPSTRPPATPMPTMAWRSCCAAPTARKALEHLDAALQSDPNLIDAVQLRALVRARLGEPAALDDVERLLESPTPSSSLQCRLRASPSTRKRPTSPGCVAHALELLARALDAGFPPSEAAADPDLSCPAPVHRPRFDAKIVTRTSTNR